MGVTIKAPLQIPQLQLLLPLEFEVMEMLAVFHLKSLMLSFKEVRKGHREKRERQDHLDQLVRELTISLANYWSTLFIIQ